MTKNILLLVMVLCVGAIYTALSDFYTTPNVSKTQKEYKPVPDFTWENLNGDIKALSSIEDKVIALNFWATWCAPCVVEFPQMVKLAKKNQDKMVLIFLSVDENKDDIKKFIKKYASDIPNKNIYVGWDKDKHISSSLFGTTKYPETYLITPSHKIYEKIIGADVEWNGDTMHKKIQTIYKLKK